MTTADGFTTITHGIESELIKQIPSVPIYIGQTICLSNLQRKWVRGSVEVKTKALIK